MSNITREGVDYFPLDVDLDDDDKILLAQEIVDPDGKNSFLRYSVPYIAIRLLMKVYQNGYFLPWDDVVCRAHVKSIGSTITMNGMKSIIHALAVSKFFDSEKLSEYKILTSKGIQKRWVDIMILCRRKVKPINPNYLLYKNNFKQKKSEENKICAEMTKNVQNEQKNVAELQNTPEDFQVPFYLSNNSSSNDGNRDNIIEVPNNIGININKDIKTEKNVQNEQKNVAELQNTPEDLSEITQSSAEIVQNGVIIVQNNIEIVQELKLDKLDMQVLSEARVGDDFISSWGKWINYRWLEHKKTYKSIPAKRQAIENLIMISNRDEEAAIKIINKSISNGWVQFFKLEETGNQKNVNGIGSKNNLQNGKITIMSGNASIEEQEEHYKRRPRV